MGQSQSTTVCCPPDSIPAVPPPAGYQEQGKIVQIGEGNALGVYVVGNSGESKPGIIILPDVFGWNSGRTRQICDIISSHGYIVVMPDYFYNQPPLCENTPALFQVPVLLWNLRKFNWAVIEKDIITHSLPYLKSLGATNVAIAGFCYGGWGVIHASCSNLFVCGVGLHPSLQVCKVMGERGEDLVAGVQCPQLILTAKNDGKELKSGGYSDLAFKSKPFGNDCVFKEYQSMQHGWINRGDLSDAEVQKCYDDAMQITLDFLAKHLKGNNHAAAAAAAAVDDQQQQ